jgi:plastocyanin
MRLPGRHRFRRLSNMRKRQVALAIILLGSIAPLLLVQSGVRASAQSDGASVAADGLSNPRGFTWDASGRLVIAQAGSGGESPSTGEVDVPPPTGPYTGGRTASVVAIDNGCPTAIASGLPSARSATGEIVGVAAVAYLGDALYALVAGGGAAHGNPEQPSGIYTIGADGTASLFVDLGAWLRANPVAAMPEIDYDPEGSFFSMVAAADGKSLWVVESNSEQLLAVTADGTVSRVADFSKDNRAPTALALAPDGGVYVGELTSAPYLNGAASVLHVDRDGKVTAVWTKLTAVTGLAVATDGTLYASQLSETRKRAPFLQPGTGSVVRRTGESTSATVATGLNFPIAVAFGPDGALYVASPAIGANDGTGTVVRFVPGNDPQNLGASKLPGPSCGDASGEGGGASGGAQPATEVVVRIFDFGFDRATLTIPVGTTVTWANTGATEHSTVAIVDGKVYWDSGIMEPGDFFSFTFTDKGTFNYLCSQHPEMTGTIVVQ